MRSATAMRQDRLAVFPPSFLHQCSTGHALRCDTTVRRRHRCPARLGQLRAGHGGRTLAVCENSAGAESLNGTTSSEWSRAECRQTPSRMIENGPDVATKIVRKPPARGRAEERAQVGRKRSSRTVWHAEHAAKEGADRMPWCSRPHAIDIIGTSRMVAARSSGRG